MLVINANLIDMDNVVLGTEVKVNVNIENIGKLTMDDYEFTCEFFCLPYKKVVLKKEELVRVDSANYIAMFDTAPIGTGELKCKIVAQLPDADCVDGIRIEVSVESVGVAIVNAQRMS